MSQISSRGPRSLAVGRLGAPALALVAVAILAVSVPTPIVTHAMIVAAILSVAMVASPFVVLAGILILLFGALFGVSAVIMGARLLRGQAD